ncbi:MAG: D-Ala-D-Ala carboxypeptidase family metallohydrolase [Rubrivivax sp.]|jgi:hypothetical protein|nr:D-Ala-D-Ala carboxypeptidase family metallohydrolase [Rubrivivax sp.]
MAADLSTTPLAALSPDGLDPQSRIAEFFKVYELTKSETADRQRIDNAIRDAAVLRAAVNLAREVLDPVRRQYGRLSPNSVYRSQALERALKKKPSTWLSTSQHARGQACDIEVPGVPTLELAEWCAKSLAAFDQIICECYDPAKGPNSGWVHVSLLPPGAGTNRRQLLSYVTDPATGRLVYTAGLQASTD